MKKEVAMAIRLLLLILMAVLTYHVIAQKDNLNVDEVLNYELANGTNGWSLAIEEGRTYSDGEPFFEKMVVHEDGGFSYADVWKNQASDTHPPFYYALLHTICSFFPEKFSIWYAGIINIVFMLGILLVVERLAFYQFQSNTAGFLAMLVLIVSGGTLQSATFLRMYVTAMFIGMCILLWHIKNFRKQCIAWQDAVLLSVLAVIGVLTHYHIIIFVVFEAAAFGGYLIIKKRWKDFVKYFTGLAAAAGISIVVFPAMLSHIFGRGTGARGEQAFGNLISGGYGERLKRFLEIISGDLFGRWEAAAIAAVLLLVCGVLFLMRKLTDNDVKIFAENVICILLPCTGYFLIVSKTAAYMTGRYIWIIYPMCLYMVFGITYILLRGMTANVRLQHLFAAILILVVGGMSLKHCRWEYSYKGNAAVETAKQYADNACVYIYSEHEQWKCNVSFGEVINYDSLVYYQPEHIEEIKNNQELQEKGSFVVYTCETEPEETLEKILDWFPNVEKYSEIAQYSYTRTFYFD